MSITSAFPKEIPVFFFVVVVSSEMITSSLKEIPVFFFVVVEAEVSSGMMTSSLSMNDMPLLATIFFSSALTLGKANEIAFLELAGESDPPAENMGQQKSLVESCRRDP